MACTRRIASLATHLLEGPSTAGAGASADGEPTTAVWVYGSLRANKKSHHLMGTAEFVGHADLLIAPDDPWCLASSVPLDWEADDDGGGALVHGETYLVDAPTLAALDKLEGFNQPGQDDKYDRQERRLSAPPPSGERDRGEASPGSALVYVIRRSDAVAAGKHIAGEGASGSPEPKKKVAVVCTSWTPNSHAEVIVSKFLQGFPTGALHPPTPPTPSLLPQALLSVGLRRGPARAAGADRLAVHRPDRRG